MLPPEPPLEYVLKTDESTFQGLFKLLKHGQPSIGLFSDEGGRILGGYSMHEENVMQMVAGLSNLWDGKTITRSTGGGGTDVLYGKRLSTHLMAQKGVAEKLLCNAVVKDQGFLSRCLMTYPKTTIGTRRYAEIDLTADPAMQKYRNTIGAILRREYRIKEGSQNDLDPPRVPLSSQAKRRWIEYHNEIENQMADGGPLEGFRDFGSKSPEHALRLAGMLTFVENFDAAEIGEKAVMAGIALTNFYLQETIRIRNGLGADPYLDLAQKVLDYLHEKWIPKYGTYLCLATLYQEGPVGVRTAKSAKGIIRILEEHGWLVKHDGPKEVCGKIRKEVWEIRIGGDGSFNYAGGEK